MDPDYPQFLIDDAEEVLNTTLNEEDREQLQNIYKAVNGQIKWGQVLDNAFPVLLEMAEELIETEGMCKNGNPWYLVSPDDEALFLDEDDKAMSRRHLLLLLLAKKILGGLKTRVNQATKDIKILTPGEEDDLLEIATQPVPDEDEEEEDDVSAPEVVANIEIAPAGDCRQNGSHIRTTVRWKRLNGDMFQETYCKDCRTVVKKVQATYDRPSEKVCQHPGAEWVEGQEGREAVCTECKGLIENPDTYRWINAGLEPFGDDPGQDEVITLCSDY